MLQNETGCVMSRTCSVSVHVNVQREMFRVAVQTLSDMMPALGTAVLQSRKPALVYFCTPGVSLAGGVIGGGCVAPRTET